MAHIEDSTGAGNQPETHEAAITVDSMFYDSPYAIGEFAPFPYSNHDFANLTSDQKNKLKGLVLNASRSDVASRRFEVEQAWEAELFERGYQHLKPRRGGGWSLPGENSRWGINATSDVSSLFATNTYSRDHDIVVSALSREIPDAIFVPTNPDDESSIITAEIADDFKDIFTFNNDLRARLTEGAHYLFTDDRVVLYTYFELNGQKYGFDIPSTGDAEVPEEEAQAPAEESSESDEPVDVNEVASLPADEPEEVQAPRSQRSANGREILKIYGKLGSKVPISVNTQSEMPWVQLYDDVDVSVAKAMFPWIADKITPGTCGIGEIELDYIARLNTKLALTGNYVTGDSLVRNVVIQWTWLRPMAFFDTSIESSERDEFLQLFPDGVLICMVGQEFAFARNENLDDHITIAHPYPGAGQNRRALGSSLIGPQKRLNNWIDLMDSFFVSTIPRKWMDNDAFNVEGIRGQTNKPGDIGPFQRQPGVPVNELIFVEPTPQPQAALPDFIMKFFTDVPQSLSGAVPSLFGAPIGGAVGSEGYAMQRDQALERMGVPWCALKSAFAEVFRQAVVCAGRCRKGDISEFVPGRGTLTLHVADLKGSVLCYPDYDSNFPESASERETRFSEIITGAPTNPFFAALLSNTHNMREIANANKMSKLEIPGEDSTEKQLGELEVLLESGPQQNPEIVQMNQQLQEVKEGIAADIQAGKEIPPDAAAMAVKFEQMVQQKIQSLPPMVSTVPVAQDESENHTVEASTLLEWMNGRVGRKFKSGSDEQKMVFANVHLHWQEHVAMAKKLAAQNAQPPVPKEAISVSVPLDKFPSSIQAQVFQKAGFVASPADFDQNNLQQTQRKIAEKSVPETIATAHEKPEPTAPPTATAAPAQQPQQ
jgi:hypothetical protein